MNEASGKPQRQSAWASHPGYSIAFEPCPRRVRVMVAGETVADSTAVMYMHEKAHVPVYYFPRDDVRMDLLTATDHDSFCPFKGEATYWSIAVDGQVCENTVWSYAAPFDEVAEIKDYLAFYWDRVDAWFEEDEEIFVHPRDPRVRVDVLASGRRVVAEAAGMVVADSTRAHFLFETGLPARYYLPAEDVRTDLLGATETETQCPYKGTARYWSLEADGNLLEDLVWSYPDPIAECAGIKELMCFFNERVDRITVDGEPVAAVHTKWSPK
jgi:uncharacterized protein (DUF427 family)